MDEHLYEDFLSRFAENRERIFAYIFALVPRAADAEDIFQKCSVILWRKFSQFRPDGSFQAWACGIARLEVMNFLRTSGRSRLHFNGDLVKELAAHSPPDANDADARLTALRECVKSLDDGQRDLVDAAYASNRTVRQHAEATGSALQTLYNRLARIRVQLLQCVQSKTAQV